MVSTSAISGLDVPALVSQLMSIERQPIEKLSAKVQNFEAKISSYGTIKGLVSDFQAAVKKVTDGVDGFSANVSDESFFTATATSTATAATYSLEVSSLARAQSLVATGQTSATAAIGAGAATVVTFEFGSIDISATNSYGGGSLSADGAYSNADFIANGSASKSITIDSNNNTLEGIRDEINKNDLGVTASIINDGSGTPYRLAIVSSQTGKEYSLKISTDGADASVDSLLSHNPAGTQSLRQTAAAENANFKVNGIDITKSSNVVTDALTGISLTLKKVTTQAETLAVARDVEGVHDVLKDFTDSYNALANQLKSRSAYKTDTSPGGGLAGDRAIQSMQGQLRAVLNSPVVAGALTSLAEIGITTQAGGGLKFDSARFDSVSASSFSDVKDLLSSSSGFMNKFDEWADSVLAPDGLIKTKTDSFKTSIDGYNNKIDHFEVQMKAIEKQYNTTYTNLNVMLISMSQTTDFLTAQLG